MKPTFNESIYDYLSQDYQENITTYPYFLEAEPSVKDDMINNFMTKINNKFHIYFESNFTKVEIIELCRYATASIETNELLSALIIEKIKKLLAEFSAHINLTLNENNRSVKELNTDIEAPSAQETESFDLLKASLLPIPAISLTSDPPETIVHHFISDDTANTGADVIAEERYVWVKACTDKIYYSDDVFNILMQRNPTKYKIESCNKQHKPTSVYFDDISGCRVVLERKKLQQCIKMEKGKSADSHTSGASQFNVAQKRGGTFFNGIEPNYNLFCSPALPPASKKRKLGNN